MERLLRDRRFITRYARLINSAGDYADTARHYTFHDAYFTKYWYIEDDSADFISA